MVSEAIGLALPGSAGAPAPYEDRDRWAVESGRAVMALLDSRLRPRDIVTRKALENAAVVVGATGGSTNAGLHLPAMAHEAGIRFTMDDVVEIMRRTPYIADLKPGGKYVAFDVHKIGGIPVMHEGAARWRAAARRLPDRHRQDAGGEPARTWCSRPTRT